MSISSSALESRTSELSNALLESIFRALLAESELERSTEKIGPFLPNRTVLPPKQVQLREI